MGVLPEDEGGRGKEEEPSCEEIGKAGSARRKLGIAAGHEIEVHFTAAVRPQAVAMAGDESGGKACGLWWRGIGVLRDTVVLVRAQRMELSVG